MEGDTGWGIYVAYTLIVGFLLTVLALSLRTLLMVSLLLLAPAAGVLRRVPGVRRLLRGDGADG